ncbi:MAG: squalene/phytoene synthase family protein [Spirochaetaceae bacterium]
MSTVLVMPDAGRRAAGTFRMTSLYRLLRRVSRTFALSNSCLPRRFREPMTIAYLLFRVSDYLEDNTIFDSREKARHLRLWAQIATGDATGAAAESYAARSELSAALDSIDDCEDAELEAARRFPELLEHLDRLPEHSREAIRDHLRESTLGMARWQEWGPDVRTISHLDDYMHQVAGIVGLMINEVFSQVSSLLRLRMRGAPRLAREYGLGLQAVNIIRGLKKDSDRGWSYVPRQLCAEFGLEPEQLLDEGSETLSLEVVGRLIDMAESHLYDGLLFVLRMPRLLYRVRLATSWPLLFAARTLAISRRNPKVLTGEAKITRKEVRRIIRHTAVMSWSNRWMKKYYRDLLGA